MGWIAILLVTNSPDPSFGQVGIEDLGDVRPWALSSDGETVLATRSDNELEVFLLTGPLLETPIPLVDASRRLWEDSFGMSADGSIVVGSDENPDIEHDQPRACDPDHEDWNTADRYLPWKWANNATTRLQPTDNNCYLAFDVSNTGKAVGMMFDYSSEGPGFQTRAFSYDASFSSIHPDGFESSRADAISADGTVIIGNGVKNDVTRALRWTQTGVQELFDGLATDVSDDGSVVVGIEGMLGLGSLVRWEGGSYQVLATNVWGPPLVSGDGRVVAYQTFGFFGPYRDFHTRIWSESSGDKSLWEILQDGHVDVGNWRFTSPLGISYDGSIIVGRDQVGVDVSAFRARISAVTVTAPEKDDLVIADRGTKIRWRSSGADSLIIQWADIAKGGDFTPIDTVAAAPKEYTWQVPDTLTRKAKVRLIDRHNATSTDTSDVFKIKGYVLTRVDANDDYEAFDIQKNAWSFCNCGANLSPPTYSNTAQFRYRGLPLPGLDPFTFQTYDDEFGDPPVRAKDTDFPDWPSFVRAFGTDDAYWGPPLLGIYREAAIRYWRDNVSAGTAFNGACAGMAVSSLLVFKAKEAFGAKYPAVGTTNELRSVVAAGGLVRDPIREVINEVFTKQWGILWESHHSAHQTDTRQETLRMLKDLLLDESETGVGLGGIYISNLGPSNAHAVVPVKLTRTSKMPNRWDLMIYDPNRPNALQTIKVDSSANSWSYGASYNGSGLFYVMDPMHGYLLDAVRPPEAFEDTDDRPHVSKRLAAQSPLRVYPSSWVGVNITGAGGSMGYADSTTYNTIPDADFFLAATGYVSSPVYYVLPEGPFEVELTDAPDPVLSLQLVREGLPSIGYTRLDASGDQTDHLSIGEGLGVANRDAATKRIYLKTLFEYEEQELVIEIHELALNEGDSVYTDTEDDALRLENFGSAGAYDLVLRRASADTVIRFHSVGVPIGEGHRHRIPPDWDNLDTVPVEIQIDADGDGAYEESMQVRSNVEVEDQGSLDKELPVRFALHQNYPNPFNPSTAITYDVPEPADVKITVFDALGRLVEVLGTRHLAPGTYTVTWDARDVPSGVYFYRLEAGDAVLTKSMLLAR